MSQHQAQRKSAGVTTMVTGERQPKTLTIEEAAQELRIGRSLAYKLARAGQLPGVKKLGDRFVVSRAAFDRFLDEDEQKVRMD
jgi:excisionase family DNA binding protein